MNSSRRTKQNQSSKIRAKRRYRKRDPWEERIRRVDPSDLRSDFNKWPSLAREMWTQASVPSFDASSFGRIVLVGMGGSLLSGELLVDLAREQKSGWQFETVKDYHLPSYCDERTLVIGMSSSGNTEETLSVLSEAKKKGLKGFAFGSGGNLESFSKGKWGFDFIRTTMLKVPRSSLPGIFYPVLKLLVTNHVLNFSEQEVDESIESLESLEEIHQSISKKDNQTIGLAKELVQNNSESFPLIYASSRTRAVALRFRQSLNENSKIHAFNGEIPELCHNEVVGWDYFSASIKDYRSKNPKSKQVCMLLRLDEDDPPEIRTRFDIVADLVHKSRGKVLEAPHTGSGYLARMLSMLYILDYTTYYAAILRGVDPIKTPSINHLKQELASRLDFVSHL